MKQKVYDYLEIMERLEQLKIDIDTYYKLEATNPEINRITNSKEELKKELDRIVFLDWDCDTKETIVITDKIIELRNYL